MISGITVLTILLMASVTWLTRVIGYIGLRNRELGPRARAVMEAAPGCVLISVIAPYFVTNNPADLLAIAITLIAASRLSLFSTVAVGIVAAALLRHLL
ncbi:AzlD family protein [Winslowiella iniecta]|uniref:Membrane protein n=1 Tax=Winslowiella iniecta TaxID=1560201 RepID=A0A0L7T881_9GAMM|nr:AzlD family protein [Winslowiella iniecta]KOC91585.1 membrane protein [Winslowiella iniecta]KOC94463.1 membrane protein [Winslowiella iniecta]